MCRQLVYLDESGDVGFKLQSGSSPVLSPTADQSGVPTAERDTS